MEVKCYKMVVLILLTKTVSVQTSSVGRTPTSNSSTQDFYTSVDTFINADQTDSFCLKNNAHCDSGLCDVCRCKNDQETFLSFVHGCKNYTENMSFLKETACLAYDPDLVNKIPLLKYNDTQCKSLYKINATGSLSSYECKVKKLAYVTLEKGELKEIANFGAEIVIENYIGERCLRINTSFFELVDSVLTKLDIECTKTQNDTIQTCFIFKVGGILNKALLPTKSPSSTSASPSSTSASTTPYSSTTDKQQSDKVITNDSKNNNTAILIGVIVTLSLILIVVVLIYLYQKRRKAKSQHQEKKILEEDSKKTSDAVVLNNHLQSRYSVVDFNREGSGEYAEIASVNKETAEEIYDSILPLTPNQKIVHKVDNPLYITNKTEVNKNFKDPLSENPLYGDSEHYMEL